MVRERYTSNYPEELRHHYVAGTPTIAILLLIFGAAWLLNSLGFFTTTFVASIPWMPTLIIVFAIGWLISIYAWKRSAERRR